MHRHRFTSGFLLACLLAGCSASVQPAAAVPSCDPPYYYARWTLDGVADDSGCLAGAGGGYTQMAYPSMRTYVAIGVVSSWLSADEEDQQFPFCGSNVEFHNMMPLVTGTSGPLSADPLATGPDGREPTVYLMEFYTTESSCVDRGPLGGVALLTGGTWHVIQGGTWGDDLIVEVRDATFQPVLGHTLRYELIRYHANVGEPVRYP